MAHPKSQVVIASHRGMAAGYPENTLAASGHPVSAGFPVIEVDLRATADDHIGVTQVNFASSSVAPTANLRGGGVRLIAA